MDIMQHCLLDSLAGEAGVVDFRRSGGKSKQARCAVKQAWRWLPQLPAQSRVPACTRMPPCHAGQARMRTRLHAKCHCALWRCEVARCCSCRAQSASVHGACIPQSG